LISNCNPVKETKFFKAGSQRGVLFGGFVSHHALSRSVQTYEQLANYQELAIIADAQELIRLRRIRDAQYNWHRPYPPEPTRPSSCSETTEGMSDAQC
jgi:hypothetical protein